MGVTNKEHVEGWIYVIGVGVTAGMMSKTRKPVAVPSQLR